MLQVIAAFVVARSLKYLSVSDWLIRYHGSRRIACSTRHVGRSRNGLLQQRQRFPVRSSM
jgi:hypothetical protein